VEVALQKLGAQKAEEFSHNRKNIEHLLEAEFAEKLNGTSARIKATLSKDTEVTRAIAVLRNMHQYQQILAINK
jgi:hypothetical protein